MAKSIEQLWAKYQKDPESLKTKHLIRLIEDARGTNAWESTDVDDKVDISHELGEKILINFFFNGEKPTNITEEDFQLLVRTLCANTSITMADERHIDELERLVQDAMVEGAFDATIKQIGHYNAHLAQKISDYAKQQLNTFLES